MTGAGAKVRAVRRETVRISRSLAEPAERVMEQHVRMDAGTTDHDEQRLGLETM
jgi:hypothetical protein